MPLTTALPIVQLIAYVMLTFASVIVAVVSAVFSYRNNFGWKPLAIVTWQGISGGDIHQILLSFEVWNRRKYPIVIRYMDIAFTSLTLDHTNHSQSGDWYVASKKLYYHESFPLGPSDHHGFEVQAPIPKPPSFDNLRDLIKIHISCFDPRRNKHISIHVNHLFKMK